MFVSNFVPIIPRKTGSLDNVRCIVVRFEYLEVFDNGFKADASKMIQLLGVMV